MAVLAKQQDSAPQRGVDHIKEGKRLRASGKDDSVDNEAPKPSTQATETPLKVKSPTIEDVDVDEEEEDEKTEGELIDEKIAAAAPLSLKDSLFDNHRSRSFAQNLRYMTKKFGFFIPELEFLKDVKALVAYLGKKVSIGNTCLFCEKLFLSRDATQSHMRDASHCMIFWEDNEDEYSEFYDWSNDERRVAIGPNEDGEEIAYVSDRHELVLVDSGKTLGHRALRIYYQQKPRSKTHQQLVTSLMQEHRRLQAIQEQKSKYLDRKALNAKADFALKTGLKTNNQKHYRNSNPL